MRFARENQYIARKNLQLYTEVKSISDNWVIRNLESAIATWNDKLAELWTLITQTPESFKGGQIWSVIVNINSALVGIGYGLLVLFFAVGIFSSAASFKELQRPGICPAAFYSLRAGKGGGRPRHGIDDCYFLYLRKRCVCVYEQHRRRRHYYGGAALPRSSVPLRTLDFYRASRFGWFPSSAACSSPSCPLF